MGRQRLGQKASYRCPGNYRRTARPVTSRRCSGGGRFQLGLTQCCRRFEQPTGEHLRVADINSYALGEAKLKLAGCQRVASCTSQP
jgi:hypothetical protein